MNKALKTLVLACTLLAPHVVMCQEYTLDAASVARWRADLAVLRREAPAHHANLYHAMTHAQFDSALASIETRLPAFSRAGVIVELERLAALIHDGHTNVSPWRDSLIAFHTLPVAMYLFSDGLMIRATDSAHTALLGARIIAIGGVPTDSAIARAQPLIGRDNEMAVKAYAPFLLAMPEVLNAIGLSSSPGKARFTYELGGVRRDIELSETGLFPMFTGDADKSWLPQPGWRDARDVSPAPLWLSDQRSLYWFRELPAERAMYVQINTIQQKPADSLRQFMTRALRAADSMHAERLVIDLRLNGGGDGSFNRDILLPLIKSRYDSAGRLYVITGRRTFSAAQMLVTELRKYTNAIFAGEATASTGNAFGDSYKIVLPNSGVTFRVSTLWWQLSDPRDTRRVIEPDLPAPLSFDDYVHGRDPALERLP